MKSGSISMMIIAGWTLFLFLSLPSLGVHAGVYGILHAGMVGQYHWSSMLTPERRKKLEKMNMKLYDDRVYSEWNDDTKDSFIIPLTDSETELLGGEEEQREALVQMTQRVAYGADKYMDKEENALMSMGSQLCTMELHCWPFGRNIYVLKNTKENLVGKSDKDETSNSVVVEFWSPRMDNVDKNKQDNHIKLPKSIRLKTLLTLKNGGIQVTILTSSMGLSKSTVGRLLRIQSHFWRERLQGELNVVLTRRKQKQTLSAVSKIASKQRKIKQNDRIAHPEKHKSVSPSVRRVASDSGPGISNQEELEEDAEENDHATDMDSSNVSKDSSSGGRSTPTSTQATPTSTQATPSAAICSLPKPRKTFKRSRHFGKKNTMGKQITNMMDSISDACTFVITTVFDSITEKKSG